MHEVFIGRSLSRLDGARFAPIAEGWSFLARVCDSTGFHSGKNGFVSPRIEKRFRQDEPTMPVSGERNRSDSIRQTKPAMGEDERFHKSQVT